MFTRCPQCKNAHALNAATLSQARGLVQCGDCGRTFSALSFLYDEWPSGSRHGPAGNAAAAPPVLEKGMTSSPEQAEQVSESDQEELPGEHKNLAWGLTTAILILVTVANIVWTFREPLIAMPAVNAWINKNDETQRSKQGLLKDPGQIQLVSRDMHAHPTRSGILVLSLTFVNLAQRTQVYPSLEITLLDATNQPVARRELQPLEYLDRKSTRLNSSHSQQSRMPSSA